MAVRYPMALGQRAYMLWGQMILSEARGRPLPTPERRDIVTEDDAAMALKQVAQLIDSVMGTPRRQLDDELAAHVMAMLAVARDYVRPLPEYVQAKGEQVSADLQQLVEALQLAALEHGLPDEE